jgi:hypothetical protein
MTWITRVIATSTATTSICTIAENTIAAGGTVISEIANIRNACVSGANIAVIAIRVYETFHDRKVEHAAGAVAQKSPDTSNYMRSSPNHGRCIVH